MHHLQNNNTILELASKRCVRIYRKNTFLGTGIVLDSSHILTAKHVVKDVQTNNITEFYVYGGGITHNRYIISEPIFHSKTSEYGLERDLAIFRVLDSMMPYIPLFPVASDNEFKMAIQGTIHFAGFPGDTNTSIDVTPTQVTSINSQVDAFKLEGSASPGMSGGPVVHGGKLIGMVYARATDSNKTYMLPANVIRDFLNSVIPKRSERPARQEHKKKTISNTNRLSKLLKERVCLINRNESVNKIRDSFSIARKNIIITPFYCTKNDYPDFFSTRLIKYGFQTCTSPSCRDIPNIFFVDIFETIDNSSRYNNRLEALKRYTGSCFNIQFMDSFTAKLRQRLNANNQKVICFYKVCAKSRNPDPEVALFISEIIKFWVDVAGNGADLTDRLNVSISVIFFMEVTSTSIVPGRLVYWKHKMLCFLQGQHCEFPIPKNICDRVFLNSHMSFSSINKTHINEWLKSRVMKHKHIPTGDVNKLIKHITLEPFKEVSLRDFRESELDKLINMVVSL